MAMGPWLNLAAMIPLTMCVESNVWCPKGANGFSAADNRS